MSAPVIRGPLDEVALRFAAWALGEFETGALIIVVEGLMGAGKSCITKAAAALPGFDVELVELDGLITDRTGDAPTWAEAVDQAALKPLLQTAESGSRTVIEGPAAWLVVRDQLPPNLVRRVYVRALSTSGGVLDPLDERMVIEGTVLRSNPALASVEAYIREEQPGLQADLIVERIDVQEEPTPSSVLQELISPEESLARELWEAYATRNQTVINFPTLHWDEVDDFTRDTWRMLARVAMAFREPKD